MTLVKLTFSLATVSATIPASRPARADRGSELAAAAPSIAPSALAPASPAWPARPGPRAAARGPRQAARRPRRGPADRSGPPAPPAAISPADNAATLTARPGRRSKRLSRLAPPAISPALMITSVRLPPSSRPPASPVAASPASLTLPVVTSPWASAPRWPLKAASLARARQVVEDPEPEGAAAGHGHDEGGVGANGPFGQTVLTSRRGGCPAATRQPGGDRGGDDLGRDRADGDGRALEERHQLAPVVGPGPGLLAGRRVVAQRPVGGARRGRADGTGGHGARDRRAGRGASGAAHFFFTDLSPFPVCVACGVGEVVGVALGTGNGTGLTADAPEIP